MKYFTADLHIGHDFVAALRGYIQCHEYITDMNAFRKAVRDDIFKLLCQTKKHDEDLLKRFNAKISKQDELYILGDLSCSSNIECVESWLSQLHVPPARRHLILGNHDDFKPSEASRAMFARQFATVSIVSVLQDCNFEGYSMTILSHLPDKSKMVSQSIDDASNTNKPKTAKYAPPYMKKVLYLHGHTHTKDPMEFGDTASINIGLDAWDLNPVSEKQITELIHKTKK